MMKLPGKGSSEDVRIAGDELISTGYRYRLNLFKVLKYKQSDLCQASASVDSRIRKLFIWAINNEIPPIGQIVGFSTSGQVFVFLEKLRFKCGDSNWGKVYFKRRSASISLLDNLRGEEDRGLRRWVLGDRSSTQAINSSSVFSLCTPNWKSVENTT